ncbi:C-C chemokine receptor type 4-like [Protopterus annectens]|uniref:C-C chemokine receptor type 4-like n=1 Tax=Protopterus annectens TaxID=7888 RepID=UPI001CFB932A|nr:C-C chemokine receptor type 4-like [Protopterus annectens]XP_043920529.1 C-C chemokine receptor type 4-like [Protopterus annectens]
MNSSFTSIPLDTTEYTYDSESTPCSYESSRTFDSVFLPILYYLMFAFGLIGNALVIWVLLRYIRLKSRSMTDIYVFNLALLDLIFVCTLPFWADYTARGWHFGAFMCKTVTALYMFGFYGGIFFITLMSVDRYLAVVHAVAAMKARKPTCGTVATVIVWTAAIFASIPMIVFTNTEEDQTGIMTCDFASEYVNWKRYCYLETNILGLLLPFSIMLFCYSQIVQNLLRCRNTRKERAVKIIFIVVIVFFVFWTPYNVVLLLHSFQFFHDCFNSININYALTITETLAFSHCCLNPIIYAFVGEKFKKYLSRLFNSYALCIPICKKFVYPERSMSSQSQPTSDQEIFVIL